MLEKMADFFENRLNGYDGVVDKRLKFKSRHAF